MKLSTPVKVIMVIKNWPVFFAEHLHLIKRDSIVYVSRTGMRCKTRPETSDRLTLNMVWVHGFYNPKGISIGLRDIVVDIGAHIGTFSIMASKMAKEGRVYAFEPEPNNFSLLEHNISINRAGNIVPFNMAVSGKAGNRFLNVSGNNVDHSFFLKGGKNDKRLSVNTITLKDIMRKNGIKHIDFLKMDCEGSEYDIFFNCPNEVLKKVKMISMEYHDIDGSKNSSTLEKFLSEKGFDIRVVPERKLLYARNLKG